jgi:tight adherence protein C
MLQLIAENPGLRALLLLLLFATVAAVTFYSTRSVSMRNVVRARLGDGDARVHSDTASMASLRADRVQNNWSKLVDAIEKRGLSLVDTKDKAVRQRLIAAGFTSPHAPRVYTLIRLALVFGLPILALLYFWLTVSSPSIFRLYVTLMISAAFGLYLPALFVRARADRRQEAIINGFPDALDLMLVCVEAGLGLEAAFARVGMEMTSSHPRLAEQLGAVVLELRAGRSHEDALRRMADRAGAEEIRAFTTLLIQSTKLGSSIAQTLRIYASEMRERRRMRAEEKAHRLPVLLSIPLVACMLPSMIGVLMLPAAIRVVRAIVPALGG